MFFVLAVDRLRFAVDRLAFAVGRFVGREQCGRPLRDRSQAAVFPTDCEPLGRRSSK